MKKMAIKGLVALAAVVALCMFFSWHDKTISTSQSQAGDRQAGQAGGRNQAERQPHFHPNGEVKLALASDPQSVTIKRVRVAKGRKVAAGDRAL